VPYFNQRILKRIEKTRKEWEKETSKSVYDSENALE